MPIALIRAKLRLRTTLVVPIILQTVAAVGLVSYLLHRNEQKTVDELVTQLSSQVSNRVSQQLNNYLTTPRQANEITLQAINLGILDPQDLDTTGHFFWKQMRLFENLSYMNFASPQGVFIGVGREDDGSLYTERIQPSDPLYYNRYALDAQGNPTVLLAREAYSFVEDEWYQSAVVAGQPVWSSIYQWQDRPEIISISSSYPVYDPSQQLVGVLGVDFILSQISDFLRQLNISPSGKVFIIERDGMIVASSSQEPPYRKVDGAAQRLNIFDSQEPLMREAAQQLRDRTGTLSQITDPLLLSMPLNQQPAFVSVTPWQDELGLDWLVVVVIPESDFTLQIDSNTRNTLGLGLAALSLAIASGILTARWVNRHMRKIALASEAMAAGDLDQYVATSNLVELDRLAISFNRMAEGMKQSFNALRQSEARNQAILNAIPDLILRIHQDGRYLDVVEAKGVGLVATRENRIGRTVYDVLPQALAEQYLGYIHQAVQSGEIQEFEYQLLIGEAIRDFEARVVKSGDQEAILFVRDITARKAAKAALIKSEERFRSLVANIPGVIYRCQCDADWTMHYISNAIEAISGYPASDFINNRVRSYASIIHPDDSALVEVVVNHAVIIQEPFVLDYRVLHQDGSVHWVYEQGQAILDGEGNPLYLDGAIFDITDRKTAEAALVTSEERFRGLVANIPGAIYRCQGDPAWTIEFISDAIATISGYPASDFINNRVRSYTSIIHPDDRPLVDVIVNHAIVIQESYALDYRILHRDGSIRWVYEQGQVVFDEEGRPLYLDGAIFDVSERKAAEETLKQKEATNRALIESIPDLLVRVQGDGTILEGPMGTSRLKGFLADPAAMAGAKIDAALPPEQAALRRDAIRRALETQTLQVYEHKLPIGGEWVDEEVRVIVTGEDEVLIMVRDISDRKRAEAALRLAEENYRSIFENALEGIFQSSPEGCFINVNPTMARIYGYDSPQEMVNTITDITAQIYVDPNDRTEFNRRMKESDQIQDFEYQVFQKNGDIIWIQEDARAVRDSDGQLLYYEGMIQDITERKRQENELRKQLEELKIEIDQKKREQEVAMLTTSSYFQEVQQEIAEVDLDEFWS